MKNKNFLVLTTLVVISLLIIFVFSYFLLKNNKIIEDENKNNIKPDNISTENFSNTKLLWPLEVLKYAYIGYPDIDNDKKAFNCKVAGYKGHEGTDIDFSWANMNKNISVLASLDGEVIWVFNGKYDRCPNPNEDCKAPSEKDRPGLSSGYRVCTEQGPYFPYKNNTGSWFWCFNGGNLIVIRHYNNLNVFATVYEHLKKNSITVKPGDFVKRGEKIAEVGSAGKSSGPHLHFEVWGKAFYNPIDPWQGKCGPNFNNSLWQNQTI